MNIITLDFESYFSDDYTLKKMTTEGYIRDPRFEIHGCGLRLADGRLGWLDRPQFAAWTKTVDWADTAVLAHHAAFDGLILSHHYGVFPKFWFDTLSMARLLLGNHLSVSLDSLSKHFGLDAKNVPYNLFRGKHWHDLDPWAQKQVADGCLHDVELTWRIFQTLAKTFPRSEYEIVDTTVRMFTEPKLGADVALLAAVWMDEDVKKKARIAALDVTEAQLQSADQFQQLLEAEGVEVQYKDGKNGQIPCFAKNDPFMQELLEDENERVQALAEARLGVKSTLLQTRAETLGFMAQRGPLPVYLKYCGAATTRWSGGDKVNWQNFTRGSNLHKAILPPKGWRVAEPDLNQIECRLLNFFAGQHDKVEDFRQGRDPYVGVASQFYGYPVNAREHKTERQVGKVLELQCGYGSGGPKIATTLRTQAKIILTPEGGERAKRAYRDTHPAVVRYWGDAGRMLSRLAGGAPMQWGPVEVRDHRIWLPNGCPLIYDTIEFYNDPESGDGYWRVRRRNGWQKLYGAKIVENCVQALARVVISQAMLRIRRANVPIVGSKHDSLVLLIKDDQHADATLRFCLEQMCVSEGWLEGVPLNAEESNWGVRQ